MIQSWKPKNWFRAYFNQGLVCHIKGMSRPLPCTAGTDFFFLDPFGEVRPCNGMEQQIWIDSFGNLKDQSFERLWDSPRAALIRERVRDCKKECWMVGNASPVMKRFIAKPMFWIFKKKLRLMLTGGRL
jgi:radical SAM protein with 4Fe4S-binding SPASM domain